MQRNDNIRTAFLWDQVGTNSLEWIVHLQLLFPWFGYSYNTRHKSLKQTPFLSNFLEKSWDLYFTLFSPPEMCLLPPQCWATRILKHWDHCDTQINIGEGEIDTSVSRFLTSIVGWGMLQNAEKLWSLVIRVRKLSEWVPVQLTLV